MRPALRLPASALSAEKKFPNRTKVPVLITRGIGNPDSAIKACDQPSAEKTVAITMHEFAHCTPCHLVDITRKLCQPETRMLAPAVSIPRIRRFQFPDEVDGA